MTGRDSEWTSLLGATMCSVRSRSGREWQVNHFNVSSDDYTLLPLGLDVGPARNGKTGKWQGGVRRIRVSYDDLHDGKKWRRVA